eukprot:1745900-Lingulodinium_polyedra.AAC.1
MGRNPQAPHGQIISWLRMADESTRARVMELVRTDPKATIGEAIRIAVTECAHEWMPPATYKPSLPLDQGHRGGRGGGGQHDRSRTPPVRVGERPPAVLTPPPPPRPGDPAKGGKKGADRGVGGTKHAQHFKSQEICKAWNDSRGC